MVGYDIELFKCVNCLAAVVGYLGSVYYPKKNVLKLKIEMIFVYMYNINSVKQWFVG